jgi:DNA primase
MRIPESTLSEIRGKIDIAEVIGEHVTLQRKGGRFWGLCPFHQEKSPSFTVTPDKGVYYCFGCHKGGTVFDFVMEVEKVPWRDAVEILAKKAGIEIPREDDELGGIKRETFLELYRRVAGSFQWILANDPQAEGARRYLADRGVTQETVGKFQLGWAPGDRDWLHRFLTQKSYSADFLARTGLFSDNAQKRTMALFANRVMFPIANPRGEVLAFGGRILGDSQPKYLNSPETAFFRKGENLYGMERAGSAIRAAGFFILVEGYMDVLAMHQAGFENCVAPLGTALTELQVRLLKRYAPRGVLLFDGDEAGRKATARAIEMLEGQDLVAQVVEITGGKDPADLVQKGDVAALRELLAHPRESFPWLVERALAANERGGTEGRERIRDWLFPFIAAPQSELRRDGYLNQLADALGADAGALRQDFQAWTTSRRRYGSAGKAPGARPEGTAERPSAVSPELFLMLAVAASRELFAAVRTGGIQLADLEDDRARALFVALEESFRAEETSFEGLCARLDDVALRDLAIRKVSSGEFDLNQERMVADGVRRIRQRALRKKIDMLALELKRAETDPARMRELLAEKMHLDGELERLKTRAAGA